MLVSRRCECPGCDRNLAEIKVYMSDGAVIWLDAEPSSQDFVSAGLSQLVCQAKAIGFQNKGRVSFRWIPNLSDARFLEYARLEAWPSTHLSVWAGSATRRACSDSDVSFRCLVADRSGSWQPALRGRSACGRTEVILFHSQRQFWTDSRLVLPFCTADIGHCHCIAELDLLQRLWRSRVVLDYGIDWHTVWPWLRQEQMTVGDDHEVAGLTVAGTLQLATWMEFEYEGHVGSVCDPGEERTVPRQRSHSGPAGWPSTVVSCERSSMVLVVASGIARPAIILSNSASGTHVEFIRCAAKKCVDPRRICVWNIRWLDAYHPSLARFYVKALPASIRVRSAPIKHAGTGVKEPNDGRFGSGLLCSGRSRVSRGWGFWMILLCLLWASVNAGKFLRPGAARDAGLTPSFEVIEALRKEASRNCIVEDSETIYARWWSRWRAWCKSRGRSSPYLSAWIWDVPSRREEDILIAEYLVYANQFFGFTPASIDAILAALNHYHRMEGFFAVSRDRPITASVKAGIKKAYGAVKSKLPVPVGAIKEIVMELRVAKLDCLRRGDSSGAFDRQVEITAIVTAWSFMLRKSEYLFHPDSQKKNRCLRVKDVSFQPGISPKEITCSIWVRGSKVDQSGVGCARSRKASHGFVDVAHELAVWHASLPSSRRGSDQVAFQYSNGKFLNAQRVSTLITRGMRITGDLAPTDKVSSHSLRVGGATTMLAAGIDIGTIMFEGRWTSTSIGAYLWASAGSTGNISALMAESEVKHLPFLDRRKH